MRKSVPVTLTLFALACGGPQRTEPSRKSGVSSGASAGPSPTSAFAEEPVGTVTEPPQEGAEGNTFVLGKSDTARAASGTTPSKIKATATHAAMKFIVLDKDTGPKKGVVISLTDPEGTKYYTEETDAEGYAEVLVPIGKTYEVTYLTLGRKDIAAKVTVADEPNQNIKLTLRYRREVLPPPPKVERPPGELPQPERPRFVLDGVEFDTGKATLRPSSFPRLDTVVEFLTYKKSARIEISGHTDNVGNARANKVLSEKRAEACRDYLVSRGIDRARIEVVGHGDERPVADNTSEDGRQKNRRIEVREL